MADVDDIACKSTFRELIEIVNSDSRTLFDP